MAPRNSVHRVVVCISKAPERRIKAGFAFVYPINSTHRVCEHAVSRKNGGSFSFEYNIQTVFTFRDRVVRVIVYQVRVFVHTYHTPGVCIELRTVRTWFEEYIHTL